jgi:hypothetical protein
MAGVLGVVLRRHDREVEPLDHRERGIEDRRDAALGAVEVRQLRVIGRRAAHEGKRTAAEQDHDQIAHAAL